MSRKRSFEKRAILPDAVYGSTHVTKFISCMMHSGKRSVSAHIFYGALAVVEKKLDGESGFEVFNKALDNVRPQVEVRSRRVGGATYQVPVEIRDVRRQALGIRWLITASRKRNGKGMINKLSAEIIDAYKGTGGAVKKKDEVHRMAESNKAFAHFRW